MGLPVATNAILLAVLLVLALLGTEITRRASLIRVLYDHDDATVRRLVQAVFAALPPGGRIIVSEPMSGGARPDRATDVYFAIYTLAMQTGRTRSPEAIADILSEVGFVNISKRKGFRSFVTSVVTAWKPGL